LGKVGSPLISRYAHVMQRLTPLTSASAITIQGLVTIAVWHDPKLIELTVTTFFALLAANAFITLVLLERWGTARAEVLRIVLNNATSVLVYHVAKWPFPVWLWLPFHAILFDGHRRVSWAALTVTCAACDCVALHDGVPWTVPIAFTTLAVIARLMTDARVTIVNDMLERTELQRQELDEAHAELKAEVIAREKVEIELRQAQKLEELGRLASGIAHEINTPLQFVSDSVHFLEEGVSELLTIEAPPSLERAKRDSFDYLCMNLPEALRLAKEGIARVTAIVASLRVFVHPTTTHAPVDVNEVIRVALTVAKHEYKYVADVAVDLGEVGTIVANASEVTQVLVNLVVNAAHAVADRHHDRRGHITVKSEREGENVTITVVDDGVGIEAAVCEKVFDPFYTTKEVGRGTGQGLAIARAIVERHSGTLSFTSERGVGSTFAMRLPVVSTPPPSSRRRAPGCSHAQLPFVR